MGTFYVGSPKGTPPTICAAGDCAGRPRWRAVVQLFQPDQEGLAPAVWTLDSVVCDAHKGPTERTILHGSRARQIVEESFRSRDLPIPDWTRTTVDWVDVTLQES